MSLYYAVFQGMGSKRSQVWRFGNSDYVDDVGKSRLSTFVTYYEEVKYKTKCLAWPRMGGFDGLMVGGTLPCHSPRIWTLSLDRILLRQGAPRVA